MGELLLLAFLAQPQCHVSAARASAIVAEAERAERRHHLPSGLLLAVVLIESGGRSIISKRRKCGGWDVGVGQVHTHDRDRFQRLLTLSINLDESGRLLRGSIDRCEAHPSWSACRSCAAGLYNAGGHKRWCTRLKKVYSRLKRAVQRLAPPDRPSLT